MTKLTEHEVNQKSLELAEVVCELEDCQQRKKDFSAMIGKEIRSCKDRMSELAQELNDDAITKASPTAGQETEETSV
jgi:hypothetical protein